MNDTPIQHIDPMTVVAGDTQSYKNSKKRLIIFLILVVAIILGFIGVFRLITGTWLGAKAEGSHSYNPYFAECEPDVANRPVLKQGQLSDSVDASNGPCVKVLQRALNDCCSQTLTEDGWLGPATGKAVRNFQKYYGLTVDGIVGPKTWTHLDYLSAIAERVYLATLDDPFLTPQEVWDQAHAEEQTPETPPEDSDSTEPTPEVDSIPDNSSDNSGQDTPNSEETPTETPVDTPSSTPAPTEHEPYQADPANCITAPELNAGTNDNDCVAKMQEIVEAIVDGDYGSVTELAVSWYAEERCHFDSENGKKWLVTYWSGASACSDDDLDLVDQTSEEYSSDDSGLDNSGTDGSFESDSDFTDQTSEETSTLDGEQDNSIVDESATDKSLTDYELTAKETLAKIKCGLTSDNTYSYVYYKQPRHVCTDQNRLSNTLTDTAFCDLQHRTTLGKLSTTLNGSCTARRTSFTPASPLTSIYNKQSNGK